MNQYKYAKHLLQSFLYTCSLLTSGKSISCRQFHKHKQYSTSSVKTQIHAVHLIRWRKAFHAGSFNIDRAESTTYRQIQTKQNNIMLVFILWWILCETGSQCREAVRGDDENQSKQKTCWLKLFCSQVCISSRKSWSAPQLCSAFENLQMCVCVCMHVCVYACACVCLHAHTWRMCVCVCVNCMLTHTSSTGHKRCLSHIQIGGGEKWLLWSGWKCVQLHAVCAGQPAVHGWGGQAHTHR